MSILYKMKTRSEVIKIVRIIENHVNNFDVPIINRVSKNTNKDPYKILIGTILSLRTKDKTTEEACNRLFKLADTPEKMVKLGQEKIEKAIFPVGFYHRKTKQILDISDTLIKQYGGKVPAKIDELLELKGVGRKTANLVINEAFNTPGICVDTHVHRISNRIGVIKTKTAKESEFELMKILPENYWIKYNSILVTFGQNLCKPISPFCSICPIEKMCEKNNVDKHR